MSTLTNEAGNVVGFYCNLCSCSLGDPRGRIAHLKGQRHRFNYKVIIKLCLMYVGAVCNSLSIIRFYYGTSVVSMTYLQF